MKIIQNTICRLCLQKDVELTNIFDDDETQDTNDISKYIQTFFAVEITKSDPYSTYVCKLCLDWIIMICKYRLQFRKNDALLRLKLGFTVHKVCDDAKESVKTVCHDSVKRILSQGITLNTDYWNINFDVKVDLSASKVSDIKFNNSMTENYLETPNRSPNKTVLRSGKKLSPGLVHKRRHSDYYTYRCSTNFEDSIALNRSKRPQKRVKMFGDPCLLADDSDSEQVFSFMENNPCESIISTANNIPKLSRSTLDSFNSSQALREQLPKRLSAQKALKNFVYWLCPKNNNKLATKKNLNISKNKFQEKLSCSTIQCSEEVWNSVADAQFKIILSCEKYNNDYDSDDSEND